MLCFLEEFTGISLNVFQFLNKNPWGFHWVEQASDGGRGASVKKSRCAKFYHSKCHGRMVSPTMPAVAFWRRNMVALHCCHKTAYPTLKLSCSVTLNPMYLSFFVHLSSNRYGIFCFELLRWALIIPPSHSNAVHCYKCETGGSWSLQRPMSASFCCLITLLLCLQIKLPHSISYIHSLKYQKNPKPTSC